VDETVSTRCSHENQAKGRTQARGWVPWPVALLNGHESEAVGFLARIGEVKYNGVRSFYETR
jgi:hypothetical protein